MDNQNLTCSISDCNNRVLAKGYCNKHYIRMRTHGRADAPVKTKAADGEPISWLRQSFLVETDDCIIWPYARKDHGQGCVWFDGRLRVASSIVCEWANGPAKDPALQAAHSCGNGHLACVNKRHVKWKTPTENSADRLLHGTDNRGEKHKLAKLNAASVRKIRTLRGAVSDRKAGNLFGVSHGCINDIHNERTWSHLK